MPDKPSHAYEEWPMSAEDRLIRGGLYCHYYLGGYPSESSSYCMRPRREHEPPQREGK